MTSGASTAKSLAMLLVEDEKPTLELLASVIARKYPQAALYTAADGKTALEIFKVHLPDIVITDINMPEMSGVQMAEQIRALKLDTRIIVLTGDTGKLALEASVGEGFWVDHYILKPIRFAALFEAIDQSIGTGL
jgi:YesN/AraC family two-component response regulator